VTQTRGAPGPTVIGGDATRACRRGGTGQREERRGVDRSGASHQLRFGGMNFGGVGSN